MKRYALSTLCLTLILSCLAHAQGEVRTSVKDIPTEKKFSAEWRLRLTGEDYHDEQSQAKVVDIRADIKAKYNLGASLHLDIQPSLRLQSGQSQSVDGADKAENRVLLNQAALVFRPFNALRFSAGALNQKYMHSSLLMDELAFPAARGEMVLTRGTVLSALALETAIPTSTSLSTNTRELEPTPSLNTAALKINFQGSKNLYLKLSGGYFIYNNLPSAVAQESRLLGNEVNQISDAMYSFTNKFEGVESTAEFKVPVLTALDLIGSAEYLINQKAAAEVNSAYYYALGGELTLTKNMDLMMSGSYFSVAPEAAVAYFNAKRFETNRVGYGIESFLTFKKEGFKVGVQYKETEVMFTNAIQSKDQSIWLKLETFYADI